MRPSNTTIQQTAQQTQVDVYAYSQQQQQVSDIENQHAAQNGRPSQPVQVVASRETALIYVRERPIRLPDPTAVVAQPPYQTSPAGSDYALSTEAKILAGIFGVCIAIGAGTAAALRNV